MWVAAGLLLIGLSAISLLNVRKKGSKRKSATLKAAGKKATRSTVLLTYAAKALGATVGLLIVIRYAAVAILAAAGVVAFLQAKARRQGAKR